MDNRPGLSKVSHSRTYFLLHSGLQCDAMLNCEANSLALPHLTMTLHSKYTDVNMKLIPLSLFWEVSAGNFAHSSSRVFVRSGTDVGREGLAHNLHSSSSLKCQVKFFPTKLIQPCLYGPCLLHWGTVMLEYKRDFPKLFLAKLQA